MTPSRLPARLGRATEQSALDPGPPSRNAPAQPRPGRFFARGVDMKSRSLAHPSRIAALAAVMLALAAPPTLAWGDPPLDPSPDSLVKTFVSLRIQPENPCAGDSVTLQLVKNGCPPCFHLRSFGFLPDSALVGVMDWTPVCNERVCLPETLSTSLGRLNAGTFRVFTSMTVVVHEPPNPDSSIHFQLPIEFEVGRDCGGPPPLCVTSEMFSTHPA